MVCIPRAPSIDRCSLISFSIQDEFVLGKNLGTDSA